METTTMVALALAVPVILFPAVFVWYLNIGGAVRALRTLAARKAAGTTA